MKAGFKDHSSLFSAFPKLNLMRVFWIFSRRSSHLLALRMCGYTFAYLYGILL
jgi:hypothetical protein